MLNQNVPQLSGELVVLEPLGLNHVPALQLVVADGKLWELWFTSVPEPDSVKAYVGKALQQQAEGSAIPFAVRARHSGEVVGCTRICNRVLEHRRAEIGYTWYGKSVQRSGINTETKLLLLDYCFNELDCIAVEFRTHWHNRASREAIARLGARQDGVLRNHQIMKDGTLRDTVVFSLLDTEWPAARKHLRFRLAHHGAEQ
ncbi:GNAT family N-acetyltransferase [Shewanella litorisediminis]|uniref:GNAT family N-acetyltransferase n=1 Tax=Shewanella litorisediminis TaxID=1173586 RepID=A0ABX7G7D2_9GAMM|nr:GNAT family protein [Shewanella litorisediminis]MCL2916642.1 GNAT family N-acetyltransferase [Shewanella litorisediminis]QRH03181.1 GNAT family N-acetyltransferase [Shewanella litorisediminis]